MYIAINIQKRGMQKFMIPSSRVSLWVLWLLPALAIVLSLSNCGIKGSPRKPDKTLAETTDGNVSGVDSTKVEWVEMVRLSGEGNLRSKPFTLSGRPCRLSYSFKGRTQALAGVYLVQEGKTLEEDGGSLLIIMKGNESGSKTLDGSTGAFYLEVLGEKGKWSVQIEEEHISES